MFLSLRKSKSRVSLGLKFYFNLDNVMLRHFSVAVKLCHHQVLVDGLELHFQGWALESNHPLVLNGVFLSWQERASVAVVEPDLDGLKTAISSESKFHNFSHHCSTEAVTEIRTTYFDFWNWTVLISGRKWPNKASTPECSPMGSSHLRQTAFICDTTNS